MAGKTRLLSGNGLDAAFWPPHHLFCRNAMGIADSPANDSLQQQTMPSTQHQCPRPAKAPRLMRQDQQWLLAATFWRHLPCAHTGGAPIGPSRFRKGGFLAYWPRRSGLHSLPARGLESRGPRQHPDRFPCRPWEGGSNPNANPICGQKPNGTHPSNVEWMRCARGVSFGGVVIMPLPAGRGEPAPSPECTMGAQGWDTATKMQSMISGLHRSGLGTIPSLPAAFNSTSCLFSVVLFSLSYTLPLAIPAL